MRLFLDSADPADWVEFARFGIFQGITTNPLLAQKIGVSYTNIDWASRLAQAKDLGYAELHIQLHGPPDDYLPFASSIHDLGAQHGIDAVVKIPLVRKAIAIAPHIAQTGQKFLMTACYSAEQALIATALGAHYIAPYLGRMSDLGIDAMQALKTMNVMCDGTPTDVMAASIRTVEQLAQIATLGTPAATIAPDIARALLDNPNAIDAFNQFESAP